MKYIFLHLRAALISTLSFILLSFLYSLLIDSRMEMVLFSLIIEFIFLYPLYLFLGNPLTYLIRLFIKQIESRFVYYSIFIVSVSIAAFMVMYIFTINNGKGTGLPFEGHTLQLNFFTFILAISSIFGVEVSEKSRDK
jgi:hypothetical protein